MPSSNNITIFAPNGTSWNEVGEFICVQAGWLQVSKFIILYYVAQAFTIVTRPGEGFAQTIYSCLLAIFFPITALSRGLDAICRRASFHGSLKDILLGLIGAGDNKHKLRTAIRAGAVGVLIREHDHPQSEMNFSNIGRKWSPGARLHDYEKDDTTENDPRVQPVYRIDISGEPKGPVHSLKWRHIAGLVSNQVQNTGYFFEEHPITSIGKVNFDNLDKKSLEIAQSSSLLKILVALFQAVYGIVDLIYYSTNRHLFREYGYSLYLYTTFPYLFTAIINLLGNLATPTYPTVYLLRNTVMSEAESRNSKFEACVIGELLPLGDGELLPLGDEVDKQPLEIAKAHTEEEDHESRSRTHVCFDADCTERTSHTSLKVRSGRLEQKPEYNLLYGTIIQIIVISLFVAITVGPFIYAAIKYPVTQTWQRKIVPPLRATFVILIGWVVSWIDDDNPVILGLLNALFEKGKKSEAGNYITKNWTTVVLWALSHGIGIAIFAWNVSLVSDQIINVGSCKRTTGL
ncbi:hypothetical protein BU24DRAFT_487956 [Aaosphaeria arxii CBS 175.79]|uniref:Uncharacterized protein n=1 Tax=Aaosphaeria arxii CBS 175.79 TaxID=1450172 RepID=A0A6A5Y7S5_9PLEO|nr:uncharacterized protein BU24DRAFT_487956 [Aaosphaeria arxii CBS 175.79]KAF2021558.1 hypothetical protein BU24DRAFT_487956 [Aaosphaeria arxii CBS 175.79]